MGDEEACLDLKLKRKDMGGESRDIDNEDGTEDDHRTQGIDDRKKSGTKRGGGRERRTERVQLKETRGQGGARCTMIGERGRATTTY